MRSRIPWLAATAAMGVVALGAHMTAEDWPHWRGPALAGVSDETRLPERWSQTENVAWRTKLAGVGVSAPVVSGDRLFVTSQGGSGASRVGPRLGQGADASPEERSIGGQVATPPQRTGSVQFVVEALGATDGRKLWAVTLPAEGDLPEVHDKHNLASASPVTDGERVYAVFGTGQVIALDVNGKQLWTRHLAKEFGPWDIIWGNGSSPVTHRGMLFVLAYHQSASYLLAMDGRTGKQLWKTDRPSHLSYSTPIVIQGPQGDELIVNSTVGIEAFDPATGNALWYVNEPNQFPIPVPLFRDGLIYLSRGYRSGPFAALRPGGRGDISKTHVVWRVPNGAPYVSSIVYYDGLIYMAGDVGVVTCVDARTGDRVWRERLGGTFTASPIAGDGKVYVFSETGETIVLKAGRTPQVVARNRISGRILSSPAISQRRLFIRTDDQIIAIG